MTPNLSPIRVFVIRRRHGIRIWVGVDICWVHAAVRQQSWGQALAVGGARRPAPAVARAPA